MKSIEVDQCVGRKVGGRDNGRGYGERGVKVKRCADLGLGAKAGEPQCYTMALQDLKLGESSRYPIIGVDP